jgi:hypothetical protein
MSIKLFAPAVVKLAKVAKKEIADLAKNAPKPRRELTTGSNPLKSHAFDASKRRIYETFAKNYEKLAGAKIGKNEFDRLIRTTKTSRPSKSSLVSNIEFAPLQSISKQNKLARKASGKVRSKNLRESSDIPIVNPHGASFSNGTQKEEFVSLVKEFFKYPEGQVPNSVVGKLLNLYKGKRDWSTISDHVHYYGKKTLGLVKERAGPSNISSSASQAMMLTKKMVREGVRKTKGLNPRDVNKGHNTSLGKSLGDDLNDFQLDSSHVAGNATQGGRYKIAVDDMPDLFTKDTKLLKPSFLTTSTKNQFFHKGMEPKLLDKLAKREAILKKLDEIPEYQAAKKARMYKELKLNQLELDKIDENMKALQVQSVFNDPVTGKLKYFGELPTSTSKTIALKKGITGTTPNLVTGVKDGGRIGYADGPGPAGVQPIESPKTTFDSEVRQMMDLTGLGLGDSVLEIMKDRASAIPIKDRKKFASGGSVGGDQYGLEVTNKIGAVESLLSGIASGLIDIPKGAFTLGASLLDLGFGTNNAAKVSSWFDDLTEFDEKAKEHWLGEVAKVGVNLGVPGYYGWKAGEKLARQALLAKRNGNYFKLTDPALAEKFKTSLNAGGRLLATMGGAAGAGVTDAIFVGDPEGVGTMGDMMGGGPTELDPNDEKIASREIVNRMKFGLDGSLFLGLIGGTGSSIKSLYRRRNDLASNNDAIDKFLSAFRPRGRKSQAYFDMERRNIGVRATDVNFASQEARKLDKHIDAIFPFIKNPFNQMGNKGRTEFMDKLNDTLLSGESVMNGIGKVEFGTMDKTLMDEVTSIMKARGAKQKDIEGVFDSFESIRGRWGRMFSRLGTTMDDDVRKEFAPLFAKKFKDYLGSTYEIFQNKSLLPLMRYKPTQESLDKVIKIFQDSADDAGKPITKEQAEFYANQVVETAKLPRDLATAGEKTSGIYFNAPDFFANRTTLSEIEGRGTVALEDLINNDKKAFGELFGKVSDPMQTMLTGTNRLSIIARRNQFFNELLKSDDLMTAERAKFLKDNPGGITPATMKGFFRETEREAVEAFGQNIKKIDIDPSRTIEAGITNPLNGRYAEKGVAEAIEESSMLARDKSTLQQLYDSFVLYPKATSQMAKTILSPVTHVRNFISAGAFASSNGLFLQSAGDISAAMKDAYKALQIPGSRMANDEYRKLLSLGVVNSNVRLGDLTKLLKDTNFGETVNSRKALRGLMQPLSKAKKWTEDMYTAEDDFWKITSYALERQRLNKAYSKYGINKTIDELDEEAADIIRNQIPNYDMVNDFIRATRKLPLGNFVSFPAEIMRTTANILQRGLKEVNLAHTLDDGRIVHPLRNIGYKRLFGLGTTVVAIPYGTVEAAKAIYDVSEEEMKALRRFVPDWSKNSTLVPIKDKDTGELKYIDFSHANAYDTMIRPITALYTGLQRGMDEGEIGREVMKGMWEGTKETLSPFVSESIWTTAISDIFLRGGRTREGNRLWTDETPWGERMNKAVMHAAKTQFPGSIETLKRMDLAIEPVDIIMKGKYDKYGQSFEFGDELAGFAGMRAVKVDPLRAMKFKIADFRTGINNARREFTSPLLRGGPVTPEQIVDRYKVASEALYRVQEKMHRDYMGALTLGTGVEDLDLQFADRVSNVQLDSIKRGFFKPFVPSENIEKAFRENAIAIGDADPYRRAKGLIERLIKLYDGMPLGLRLPEVNNPFKTSGIGDLPVMGSPAFQGLMNSPVTTASMTVGVPNVQQQQQTAMAGQQVFGANDTIFGVG